MKRNYLGLSCTVHDSSIAVVDDDGRVVFAEALERSLQNKRAWMAAPDHIMLIQRILAEYCEPGAQIVTARSWSRWAPLRFLGIEAMFRAINSRVLSSFELYPRHYAEGIRYVATGMQAMLRQTGSGLRFRLQEGGPNGARYSIDRFYDHHLTHAASAAFASPFRDAVCLVIDGGGELRCASAFKYVDGKLTEIPDARSPLSGSLGGFYALLCEACGFDHTAGEEWKVMGLAAYGSFQREYYELLRPAFELHGLKLVGAKDAPRRFKKLLALFPRGTPPLQAADLAHTGQHVFCELYIELLRRLHSLGVSDNVIVAGGCALNSSANGRVLAESPFRALFVPSAPADDGNAVGAALLAHREDHPESRPQLGPASPYLGSTVRPTALKHLLRFGNLRSEEATSDVELAELVARLIADGEIVGWVQGRAEFGPRALGNRSILADPRTKDIKATINERIKFREEFRPFAPSVLHEDGARYFEDYQPSPYMERTLRFTELGLATVPGVVHVDGTGRLQTVTRDLNPRYYELISAFKRLTGVPILLNTSFNVMGKPIVDSVEDAVAVLMTSGLDVLVIDRHVFYKNATASAVELSAAE